MKKKFLLIPIFIIVLLAVLLTPIIFILGIDQVLIYQTVSTDKVAYFQGEDVTVSYYELHLAYCTCSGDHLEFYKEVPGGWDKINHQGIFFNPTCVNGKLSPISMGCDVVGCQAAPGQNSWDITWDGTLYEQVGETQDCEIPASIRIAEDSIPAYENKLAPPGRYKARIGSTEVIFEILPRI